MNQESWNAVDHYFSGLFLPADPSLESTLKASVEAGLPAIHVAPVQGKLLMLLAQAIRARSILEIGTLGGYSTLWLARGMAQGGRLVTLEAEARHAEVAKANLARAGVAGAVDLRLGPAAETLSALLAEGRGPFDLIFIDADKEGYPEYFKWALKLSRKGTLIVADNVVRAGKVVDPESPDPRVQGVRRFAELAAAEPRVSATAIQTVGSKGYDGMIVALVVAEA